jgi:hypothetical protein
MYRIDLEYKPTGERIRLINAYNISVDWKLNRAGGLSLSLPFEDENLNENRVQEGLNYAYVYKDDNLIWYGVLAEVRLGIGKDNNVDLVFKEVFYLLENKRNITSTYENVDSGDIAWDMINNSQLELDGDLGITQGAITATKNRDRTYERESIGAKIIQLTEVTDGFDFEITPSLTNPNSFLKFNVYTKRGTTKPNLQFDLSDKVINNNISSLTISRSLDNLANRVIAEGEGQGALTLLSSTQDSTLQEYYGVLEKITQHKTTGVQANLDDTATEELRIYKQGLSTVDLQVSNLNSTFGLYDVGDIIYINLNYKWLAKTLILRIYSIKLNISENGEETINLQVSEIL